MDIHHKRFYSGVRLSLLGVGVSIIGAVAPLVPIIYIGAAGVVAGNIIVLNSHESFKNNAVSLRISGLSSVLISSIPAW